MAVVALVLVSALLHAMWNAGLRLEVDKDRAVVVAILIATLVAAVVAVARWPYVGPPFTTWDSVGWTAAAGAAEAIYFAGLARALALGPLGPVYTVSRGGAVLVVWPVSVVMWAEPVTAGGIVGSSILLVGLVFSGAERGAPRAAIAWAAACAVCIAGYHLAYKAALAAGGDPPAVFALSLGLATVINVVRLGGAGRREARALFAKRWARLIIIGTICSVAFLLLMQALVSGGAGLVLTLRNTSVVFATGFAAAIGDRPGGRQVTGAILVAAGAIVLAAHTR